MSSETPGGVPDGNGNGIPSMSVRSISDEITIYEITSPIPSKPTLKPVNFEIELLKTSPSKVGGGGSCGSVHHPHQSNNMVTIEPVRTSQPSPYVPIPTQSPGGSRRGQNDPQILVIPSKPELTVTVVNSEPPAQAQVRRELPPLLPVPVPVIERPEVKVQEQQQERSGDMVDLKEKEVKHHHGTPTLPVEVVQNLTRQVVKSLPAGPAEGEVQIHNNLKTDEGVVKRKRRKRDFTPVSVNPVTTMYRTRTVVKASLAAQTGRGGF